MDWAIFAGLGAAGVFAVTFAHKGAPKLADVLNDLASDAGGIENARDFEDWAGEYGYDTDSRNAEKVYEACKAGTRGLERLLGRRAMLDLINHVERL